MFGCQLISKDRLTDRTDADWTFSCWKPKNPAGNPAGQIDA